MLGRHSRPRRRAAPERARKGPSTLPKWLAFLLEGLFWWAACAGLWVLTLSTVPLPELLLGLVIAVPCASMAVAGRRAAGNAWKVEPGWLKAVALLPLAIVTDSIRVLVTALPGRRRPGAFTTKRIAGGAGEEPIHNGRRALATWLTSATPGSIVTTIDVSSGDALVHVLVGGRPRMDEAAMK